MEVLILLFLIFLNALFVMTEMALVSVRKGKLEALKNKGNVKASIALKLSERPEKFLSTVQLGITLISILTGLYSGEKFSKNLLPTIEKIDFLQPHFLFLIYKTKPIQMSKKNEYQRKAKIYNQQKQQQQQ